MNILDAYYVTKAYITGNVPLFIWGHRGLGKSTLVRQIAEELNIPVVDLRLATQEVSDLIGIPTKEGDRTVWLKPSWFPDPDEQPEGILFLDEMNRAQRDVRQATFQLVLDRKLHTHELPPGWKIIAAGNYFGAYDVVEMDEAMMSRFGHIDIEADHNAVCNYGIENRWAPRITNFLRANPKYVIQTPEDTGDGELETYSAQPDPRRWEMVDKLIQKSIDVFPQNERGEHLVRVMLTGLIGEAAARTFMSYSERMPSFEDVLTGETTFNKIKKTIPEDKLNTAIEKTCMEVVPILKNREFNEKEYEHMVKYFLIIERRDLVVGILQEIVELRNSKRLKDDKWANTLTTDKRLWKLFENMLKHKNIDLRK